MSSDSQKTNAQLVEELESLWSRVVALEQLREYTDTYGTNTAQRDDFLQELCVTAEGALRESEEKYRTLVESSPYCIHQIDRHGQMISMNHAGLQMLGEEDESAVIGVPYLNAVCEEDRERISKLLDAAYVGECSEFEFRSTLGLEFRSNFVPVCDVHGNVIRLLGITQDITERKRGEEALRHSEALMSKAQQIAHIGSFEWDITRGKVVCSDETLQICGITQDDFGGSIRDLMPLIHPNDRDRIYKGIEQALKEGVASSLEYRIVRPDGSVRWVSTQAEFVVDAGEAFPQMTGFVQDITERKRAEETLKALQTAISEVTGDELFPRVINMLTQSLGMSYAHIGELVGDDSPSIRTIACCQDGQEMGEFSYSLSGTPCKTVVGKTFQIYRGQLWEQFPGNDFLKTHRYKYYVGGPIFYQTGKPLGVLCAMSEKESPGLIESEALFTLLAARCGAEIERRQTLKSLHQQQAALAHAGRVAAVGELSSGIIHEISQPLFAVSNFSGACRRTLAGVEFEGSADVADFLDRITRATKTAQEIVKRLRGYLKPQNVQQSAVAINDAVEEVVKLLAFEIRNHRVTIECDLAPGTTVFANPVQLQQVLVNLIINACEALQAIPAEDRLILIQASIVENEVEVTVEDNGDGISEEASQNLFEPFFTTKVEGLGVGMTIAKNIITQLDGKIWFTSPPQHGTVFHFTLPVFRTNVS